ncbi:hypothetical protein EZV62_017362 [Acer yangbiense]|uniref:Fe2OG dioxygenase domain-containing protein n=1 Tax=Acer yangbiense TaxID=1000413 RepID=A0A5C7HGU5_9ROSI|nr:hypothetical protein EZV62_017362 [Acer yangbiense]
MLVGLLLRIGDLGIEARDDSSMRREEDQTACYKTQVGLGEIKNYGMATTHRDGDVLSISALDSFHLNRDKSDDVREVPSSILRMPLKPPGLTQWTIILITDFHFIWGGKCVREGCWHIVGSCRLLPSDPNRATHSGLYGSISYVIAVIKFRTLVDEENSPTSLDSEANSCTSNGDTHSHIWKFYEENIPSFRAKTCKSISASVLLRKLRWSTLGLQFDWSKRNYDVSLPHNKIPDELCQLAKKLAAPAMPMGEDFRPEAAIVNYFGLADSLGGHLDDMEADWSKPIVSMSLGSKAIFLLGGKSRQDLPVAMFLRSGDAVLMAGEARECFHGVPRIFTDKENAEIAPLELQFSHEDDHFFLDYIRTSRININIRQVF